MIKEKIYLTFLILLILVGSTVAQLDFRVTSAFGKMALNPNSGLDIDVKSENYYTVGIQADYYVSRKFGFGIGADYNIRNTQFEVLLTDYSHSYNGIDRWDVDPVPREYEFTIKSNAPGILEQNTMSFIDFPVSAVYNHYLIKNLYLTTRAGLKIGWPLEKAYILQESDLFTRLYFEEWDLELFNIPAHGLYDSRTDWHPEGELDLNPSISFFTEVGIDFPVSLLKIRMSAYFSNSLNSIINEKQTSLIYWREDYNYILSLAEHIPLMQYGVKVGIGVINRREKSIKYSNRKIKFKRRTKCDTWMW
jgi:hypothetical protein